MPDNQSDRIDINPRQRFQRKLRSPDEFKSIVAQQLVQDAVQDVLAHMTLTQGVTREMLNGAVLFADIFLNFAEPAPKITKLPVKTLQAQ